MYYSKKELFMFIGGFVLVVGVILLFLFGKDRIIPSDKTSFKCEDQITYQGDTYNIAQIGNQCWFKQNLKTTKYRDSAPISNLIIHSDWAGDAQGAYACYHNDKENCNTYGALYNWYAVNNETGLCPEGWSVPTHNQWTDLERTVCNELGYNDCETKFPYDESMGWKGTDEGNRLKSTDFGEFGGFRNANGPFFFLKEKSFWWTPISSEESAYARIMDIDNQGVRRVESVKNSGFSVRCVQNDI